MNYAVSFTTNVPINVLKEKLLKLRDSLYTLNPSGNWRVLSCHLDAEICKIKGFGTEIPDLLNEIFGNNYICVTTVVLNDMTSESISKMNGTLENPIDDKEVRSNIAKNRFQDIIDKSRSIVFSNNGSRFGASKVFVITNGELGNIGKEVALISEKVVIL